MESGGGKGVGVWGERKIVSKHKPVALECLAGKFTVAFAKEHAAT